MRGQTLKLARKAHDLTQEQVAHRTGIAQAVLSRYERGAPIGERNLPKLEAVFGAEELKRFESQLGSVQERKRPEPGGALSIPVYDAIVSAGHGGVNSVTTIIDHLPLQREWVQEKLRVSADHLAAMYVTGDSMSPFAESGDMIIVDRSHNRPGDGYYVLNVDGVVLFKRTQWLPASKELRIMSTNQDYQDYTLREDSGVNLTVIGKAIFAMRWI